MTKSQANHIDRAFVRGQYDTSTGWDELASDLDEPDPDRRREMAERRMHLRSLRRIVKRLDQRSLIDQAMDDINQTCIEG